jgi:hypothetical protein
MTCTSRLLRIELSSFGSVHSRAIPLWLSKLVEVPFFGIDTIFEVRHVYGA